MANYFNLTLDTLGPAGISLTLNSGATYATTQLINAVLTTTDGNTSGYQSRPVRARELKPFLNWEFEYELAVAPRAGA